MPALVTARVRASGEQADLDDYRRRLNASLDEDFDGSMKELHTPGQLEYSLSSARGLPFPALVSASAEVPALAIDVTWESREQGVAGSARIQGGRLESREETRIDADGSRFGVDIRARPDGTLVLAIACRRDGEDWIGYAVTASEHAFFRLRPGPMLEATDGVELAWAERWRIGAAGEGLYAELDPREPLDEALAQSLGGIANAFADEWLWFDADAPIETAIERQRFAAYGYAVRDANLRSARLRGSLQLQDGALAFTSLDEAGREAAATVARHWLHTERPASGEA